MGWMPIWSRRPLLVDYFSNVKPSGGLIVSGCLSFFEHPMNIMIVGSSGMVGQGVLRACLRDGDVRHMVLPLRHAAADLPRDERIETLVLPDLMQLSAQDARLQDLSACFFCAGVSSLGVSEADYRKTTLELTTHIAGQMAAICPDMVFIYVSNPGRLDRY
ncbi:MAG: hypothetical protein Q4F13_07700 [Pseudomonadota bacterium]|nr:hypothetical protein [Pseudomonadota bacterium]